MPDNSRDIAFFSSRWRVGAIVSFVAFSVYQVTLAPGVTFIDSGELSAVACTLGIAHPTGYPLFTLLGWLFAQMPLPGEEIFRLNLMAAILCAGGVFFFFQLLVQMFTLVGDSSRSHGWRLISAGVGSLFLAFSETYWSQATSVEVYSLHIVFLSVLLVVFFRAYANRIRVDVNGVVSEGAERHWLGFAFLVGLAFTNHMTTILLAPGLLYLFFACNGFHQRTVVLLAWMSGFCLIGLSLYSYLPLRALQDPLFNWGDPVTFDRFFSHLRGKQYSVWIFSSAETALRQLVYFVKSLPEEFGYVGCLLALIGVHFLSGKRSRILGSTGILFLTCLVYAVNYDIHDIDSYFLLAYFVVAIWAGFGVYAILQWKAFRSVRRGVLATALFASAFVPLLIHFEGRNESRNFLVNDYATNMLNSIEPNGIVLSFQWDYWVSASYYLQYVKGLRPDVVVVDKELIRRSWYLKELERRYPWLIRNSSQELSAFLPELQKFEDGRPYDSRVIQARFEELILSFFSRNSDRPLYVTGEVEPEFTVGFERVPEGLAFRLVRSPEFRPSVFPELTYRPLERRGRLEDGIRRMYADALTARGIYYLLKGDDRTEARSSFVKALGFDPGAEKARSWLRRVDG